MFFFDRAKIAGIFTVVKVVAHYKVIVIVKCEIAATIPFAFRAKLAFMLHELTIYINVFRVYLYHHAIERQSIGAVIVNVPMNMFGVRINAPGGIGATGVNGSLCNFRMPL